MFKTFKGYFRGKKSLKFSQGGQPFDRCNFENGMDAALDDTLLPRQRAQRLEDVSVFLSHSVFKYGNLKDLAWTRDIMLELWRSILSLMNMQGERLPSETRQACNKCILGIIKRKEFRLEIMGFNTEQITIEKNDEPVWRRFYSLLRNTFVYCVRRINQVENLACSVGSDRSVTRGLTYNQDYVAGELVFCSEILAIAYFRIPGVTVHIVTRIRQMLLLKKPEFLKSEDDQIKNPNGWKAHTKVNITSHFKGEMRHSENWLIVPYDIPSGNIATYFPEANSLVPLHSTAEQSNTPTSKWIVCSMSTSDTIRGEEE